MTRHDWAHGNKGRSVISIQNMIESKIRQFAYNGKAFKNTKIIAPYLTTSCSHAKSPHFNVTDFPSLNLLDLLNQRHVC